MTTIPAIPTRHARPEVLASPTFAKGDQFRIPAVYGYKPTFEVTGVRGDQYDVIDINEKVSDPSFQKKYSFSDKNFKVYAERGELVIVERRSVMDIEDVGRIIQELDCLTVAG